MTKTHARIIVNPTAGAGATHRRWPGIRELLKSTGLSFDHVFTEDTGHGIELAREAADKGYRYLVAVGGDGTINEVANGILYSDSIGETVMGIVSTGTGSDFNRSMGIPRDFLSSCSCLTSRKRVTIDVGVVAYCKKGEIRKRFFVNAAGIGFDAAVVEATERASKRLGGTIPYVMGLLRTLAGYRNKSVVIRIDNQEKKARVLNVVVANGRYIGGGMQIAPLAKIDDSLFDVLVIGDISKIELLKTFPRVYKGTHLSHPMVSLEKATEITIESPEPFSVYADGEPLGEGPASFQIIPGALSIVV